MSVVAVRRSTVLADARRMRSSSVARVGYDYGMIYDDEKFMGYFRDSNGVDWDFWDRCPYLKTRPCDWSVSFHARQSRYDSEEMYGVPIPVVFSSDTIDGLKTKIADYASSHSPRSTSKPKSSTPKSPTTPTGGGGGGGGYGGDTGVSDTNPMLTEPAPATISSPLVLLAPIGAALAWFVSGSWAWTIGGGLAGGTAAVVLDDYTGSKS